MNLMLCYDYHKLDEKLQKEVFADGNDWYFEEKVNGVRMLIEFDPKTGFKFTSRNGLDYTDKFPITDKCYLVEHPFRLDCELRLNENHSFGHLMSNLNGKNDQSLYEFVAFDNIPEVSSVNLKARRRETMLLVQELRRSGFPVLFSSNTNIAKRKVYKDIIAAGGEGVVAKRIDSTYHKDGRRSKDWIKIKPEMEPVVGTVRGFTIGKKGARAGLVVGLKVYRDGEYIATVTNFTKLKCEAMTVREGEYRGITKGYLGMTVEVSGLGWSKNGKVINAKLV